MFAGCDLVLVEGDIEAARPKIEVWRRDAGPDFLCSEHSEIAAIVTDDDPGPISVPIFPRRDLSALLRLGFTQVHRVTRRRRLRRDAMACCCPHCDFEHEICEYAHGRCVPERPGWLPRASSVFHIPIVESDCTWHGLINAT
jgi:hypothetical protein